MVLEVKIVPSFIEGKSRWETRKASGFLVIFCFLHGWWLHKCIHFVIIHDLCALRNHTSNKKFKKINDEQEFREASLKKPSLQRSGKAHS